MKRLLISIAPKFLLDIYTNIKTQINNFKILSIEYGQYITIKSKEPVDSSNSELPWYTYPAIEFLKKIDFSKKNIFEWGLGNSSIWWARKAHGVVSIEDDEKWYNKIRWKKLNNQEIYCINDKDDYVKAIKKINGKFDIIIVDGNHRLECAREALDYLTETGMVILDNSDWFVEAALFLRKSNLIQVDFVGFGPINGYTWVTSIFLRRGYNFTPLGSDQPGHCIGGLKWRVAK